MICLKKQNYKLVLYLRNLDYSVKLNVVDIDFIPILIYLRFYKTDQTGVTSNF